MSTGLVLGKFYPPHAGHHELIAAGLAGCQHLIVLVAGATVESIPLALRHRWLAEAHPAADVRSVVDDVPIDMDDPAIWDRHLAVWRSAVAETIDVVFTGEAYGDELARRLGARHVRLDRAGISGTAVRADPAAHWGALGPGVRAHLAKRVVVVGAESTGTTTLARDLAQRLGAPWVPEYGHELSFAKLAAGTFDTWTREELVSVAVRQSATEDAAARSAAVPLVVCDTDPFATQVWEERYLGSVSADVAHVDALRPPPALYLLTDHAGVPFEQDGTRDGEHLRAAMTERFAQLLARRSSPWLRVAGPPAQRLRVADAAARRVLAAGWRFAPPL